MACCVITTYKNDVNIDTVPILGGTSTGAQTFDTVVIERPLNLTVQARLS